MRLTLRSLLAYLDGLLPAADQEDLAGRVATNAVAQSLVMRIRQVVAQPAINAPRPLGRGLADDPNSVAEYLDNTLPSQRLETFERICIESDAHLAEVAACHAILAEVARDPAAMHDLDEAERLRLLRAVRQQLAGLAAEVEREEARANADVVRAAMRQPEAAEGTIFLPQPPAAVASGTSVGHRPGRPGWMAWASAAVALLLLVSLGGVLAWSMRGRGPRGVAKQPEPAPAPQPEVVAIAEPAPAAPPAPEADAEASAASIAAPDGQAAPQEAIAEGIAEAIAEVAAGDDVADTTTDELFPPPPEEPAPAAAPVAQPLVPQGNALAIAAPAAAAAIPAIERGAAPTPADAKALPPVGFVGASSLLLHRGADGEWAVVGPDAALAARESLVAVPGSSPDINIGGVTIRLLPGTEAMTDLDEQGTPRITVARGRIVARASRGDARLGIAAAQLAGTVTAGLTAPVAVSVEVAQPAGADPAAPPRIRAEVATTSGAIGWEQRPTATGDILAGIAAEGMLEARSALVWESTKPALVAITRRPADPEWAAAPAVGDAVEKRAAEAVTAKLAAGQPVSRSLHELATDRRAENRCLAAATLAVLGDYTAAAEWLSADEPGRRLEARQWTTLEAQTVPLALARGPAAAAALEQAFITHGPHGKGPLLATLARGFTDDELAAGAAAMLVESLDDPDLVVRRYAIKNLLDIVQPAAADRLRYRADGLPDLRREGVNWWRSQEEKGLIRRPSAG